MLLHVKKTQPYRTEWKRDILKIHSGNNPGRVKRVVSYKRKTRHLVMARKKPQGSGRTHDAANKDNKRQEMFDTDPQVLMPDGNHMTGRTLTRDHSTITEVLLGRNLRLKVALSLWKRHFGELITYFQRYLFLVQYGSFNILDHDSSDITIGCCVDLFPLVHKVLISPYEGYVIVGLTWIHSVLKRWREPLKASGCTGSTEAYLDRNFPVFNQQLLELWHREPKLKSFPGAAGDVAKVKGARITAMLSKNQKVSLIVYHIFPTGH
uniref:Katanin p80 subunit C-terminal domain-containing protein n=1 Tax=Hippocampus comes TaxID=109280 RepID=A0A3Q3E536_HIPCM